METATLAAPAVRGTGSRTIADLLPRSAAEFADRPAVTFKDGDSGWVSRSYTEVGETVRELALGLMALGIERGDKVSILANTRPEWTYFDFAALSAGATVVPIYQTNSPEECQYVIENSDAKVVVCEDDTQLEKIRAVRGSLPKLEHVILMEGSADDAMSTADLVARGAGGSEDAWRERYESVGPDDICTFIYTSGTTGPPKGCVISHGNYRAMLDMVNEVALFEDDELIYLFLPLAHSFALLIQLGSFDLGGTLAYWERDPLKIVPNLSEVRPTYFPSVPRIFEKIHGAIVSGAEKEGPLKERVFRWAIATGKKMRECEQRGEEPGYLLRKQYDFADRNVLSKIRGAFGGRIRRCATGAAPIAPEILEFFWAANVLILEGYGMTETSTAATINHPDAFRFGTIGKPLPGVEVKIAEDGEILVKGPNIFQGYYKNAEATRETLEDGWLHTGDLGSVDEDGFVRITGRKKDIIITAGGKNITPANFENDMKQHPLISQCVMVGDRRPYLVCLVTLDPEEAAKFAADNDLPADTSALAEIEQVRESIQAHMDKVNRRYAKVEQVKKFRILPEDLSQPAGELTPTLKVKRNVVIDKYDAEIDSLYA